MTTITLAPPEDAASGAPAGERIGDRYRIVREIGRGGMGEVVAAFDEQIQREVAIKRPRTRPGSERLLREAKIQGRLEHPAIVPVHEIGHDAEGLPFFVMKKLTGTTLRALLGQPRERLLRAFADVCLAIELAHVRGIVHRDLKPENIMLGELGEVYVLDWGVAAIVEEPDAGAGVGTPGYMAPEQVAADRPIDGRADIFALGCVLFEILAGEPLHPSSERMPAECDARPSQRARDRAIPPELDALCVAATALDRDRRLASARALGEGVQRYLDGDRDLALRKSLAREHLEHARLAYRSDDRGEAMRDAAAALALDPLLREAAALVGLLMLEPPRTMPPEVVAAVRGEDVGMVRANTRGAAWILVITLATMPLAWWVTPPGSPYFRALLAVLGAALVIVTVAARTIRPGLVVLANAMILAFVARMCSPFLIAPGLAAVLGVSVAIWPRLSWLGSALTIAIVNIAAVLVPWACEWLGLLSPTMTVERDAIVMHAPGLAGTTTSIVFVAAVYATALIAAACAIGATMRARHHAAHEALQLQAWQLRQLVPS